jgi:hypothetical protein
VTVRAPLSASGPAASALRSPAARGWWLAALGGLAVVLILLVQRPGTPPLYDGVGFPDEPYRWVQAPAGEPATAPPTSAKAELTVQGDHTTAAMVASAEQGPQVAVFVNTDTLKAPAGAKKISVEAVPARAPAPITGGTPVSNIYSFSAKADADGPVGVVPGSPALINMRASKAVKGWVVLHRRVGNAWKQMPTFQVGTDVYAASLTAFGEYALFKLDSAADLKVAASKPKDIPEGYTVGTAPVSPGASPGASPGGGPSSPADPPLALDTDPGVSNNRLWFGLGLAALILGGGLLLARAAARRQAAAEGPAEGPDEGPEPDPGSDPGPGPGSGAAG